MLHAFSRHADSLRRLLAGGMAALVLTLGLATASPVLHDWLHDWLHGADGAAADDDCAVVMFAAGVTAALGAIVVANPEALRGERVRLQPQEFFLVSPRYLRQPERGPPAV